MPHRLIHCLDFIGFAPKAIIAGVVSLAGLIYTSVPATITPDVVTNWITTISVSLVSAITGVTTVLVVARKRYEKAMEGSLSNQLATVTARPVALKADTERSRGQLHDVRNEQGQERSTLRIESRGNPGPIERPATASPSTRCGAGSSMPNSRAAGTTRRPSSPACSPCSGRSDAGEGARMSWRISRPSTPCPGPPGPPSSRADEIANGRATRRAPEDSWPRHRRFSMNANQPEAGGRGASEPSLPPGDDELERRWRELFQQMATATRWLARGADFVLKAHRGRRYWCLRFNAIVRGRRCRGTILIGDEQDTELLRRARLAVNRLRAEAVALECLLRCARLAERSGRGRDPAEDFEA